MISVFNGITADDVWMKLVKEFQLVGTSQMQNSRNGKMIEILHAGISISDPRQRWVMGRRPALNLAFALAEVIWIVNGRRDLAFIDVWNSQYKNFVGEASELHGAYGDRLRTRYGLNQMKRAYQILSRDPDSRQVVLQIWSSMMDMPESDATPASKDVPCNINSMLKVRNGQLEWTQIIRSNDMFLGLPYNLVQFTSLQEIMAGWLNIKCGSYNQISDSMHIYETDIKNVFQSYTFPSAIRNLDSLALPYSESELVWRELESRVERMRSPELDEKELRTISQWDSISQAYQNILSVLAAEVARRRNWGDLANEIMESRCTNPVFSNIWAQWYTERSR